MSKNTKKIEVFIEDILQAENKYLFDNLKKLEKLFWKKDLSEKNVSFLFEIKKFIITREAIDKHTKQEKKAHKKEQKQREAKYD